jgi:hypothetical protein
MAPDQLAMSAGDARQNIRHGSISQQSRPLTVSWVRHGDVDSERLGRELPVAPIYHDRLHQA